MSNVESATRYVTRRGRVAHLTHASLSTKSYQATAGLQHRTIDEQKLNLLPFRLFVSLASEQLRTVEPARSAIATTCLLNILKANVLLASALGFLVV
jgi:hypothetical protein